MAETTDPEPVRFVDLSADATAGDAQPMRLESLCMNCYENGQTTMLLTRVPHFREIVICAFECPHCNWRNSEVQFAGQFGEQGVRYRLAVPAGDPGALSRQVVKADTASVSIPELEFEIPAGTQKGTVTTLEGLLTDAANNLRLLQEERRATDAELAAKLDAFLAQLDACASASRPFTLILDDPAGNSYLESAAGDPAKDPLLTVTHYERTREQQIAVGLLAPDADADGAQPSGAAAADAEPGASAAGGRDAQGSVGAPPEIAPGDVHHGARPVGAPAARRGMARIAGSKAAELMARYSAPEDVMELPGSCFACGAACATRAFQTNIPYFKEVLIMSNACDACGYRNAEVKPGGGVSERGRRLVLQVERPIDLSRDVIKSDSATVAVPEIELELSTGTMGGLVTTVEGLLSNIGDALRDTQSFHLGDSARALDRSTWGTFFQRLQACQQGDQAFTLVITDPLANSYISPPPDAADGDSDPRLEISEYERSAEEDEDLGIAHLVAQERQDQQQQAAAGGGGEAGRAVPQQSAEHAQQVQQPQHAEQEPS